MFDVIWPSRAFSVETIGRVVPCGHSVRKPIDAGGTTVALRTKARAAAGMPHPLPVTLTSNSPLNGCDPAGSRVSSTRHGVRLYRDNPPAPGAAKYPLMSMIRSVAPLGNTSTDPFVPAGIIAAFATTVPVTSFSTEAKGCGWPVGHAVMNPSDPGGTAVKFNEYACAEAGMLQEPERNGKVRL